MKKRDSWFLVFCIIVFIVLIFVAPSYGWRVRAWLDGSAMASVTSDGNVASLAAENEALKAQLAQLQGIAAELPNAPTDFLRAMVYSRYPMNFKSEFLVNAGANDGVIVGKAVVFQGILVGAVENVFADSALVETIFDSGFKMPVRIGPHGYDALLVGGSSPATVSIAKTATLSQGDVVYAAMQGIPYGLPIGLVAATSTSSDDLFQEATLNFAYDINAIQTVLIAE